MYDFRLQRTDGSPFDPPTYRTLVLSWRQGDEIPLHPDSCACSGFVTTTPISRRR